MFDDLIQQKLVTKREYTDGNYAGLSVFKYSRSVFYNNSWNNDPRLVECRGIVLDSSDKIITYPFTKVFNYFQHTGCTETGDTIDLETIVVAPRKMNGFMAAVSLYNNRLLVSTTGTLDSDYATLAASEINYLNQNELMAFLQRDQATLMFEICHASDPHIIPESPGVYLIGYRRNEIGSEMASEAVLDAIAAIIGAKRPECITGSFGALIERSRAVKHEGFMVRDSSTGKILCKIKSPYYLTKKFLMRLHTHKVQSLYENKQSARAKLDEEYYPLLDHIVDTYTCEEFCAMDEAARAAIIDNYFSGAK